MSASFDAVLGSRRGEPSRAAADGDWRETLAQLRARGAVSDEAVAMLADAVVTDLHRGFQHSAVHALSHFGAASTKARRVARRGKVTHLLTEPAHTGKRHVETMCGSTLLDSVGTDVHLGYRGVWAEPVGMYGSEARLCKKCIKHQHLVPDASELRGALAFHPEEHEAFDQELHVAAAPLARRALTGDLSADELEQAADRAYLALLLDHAVMAVEASPVAGLRGVFSGTRDAHYLRQELGWPGELDELLDEVDWRALFAAGLPKHRRDLRHATITAWQEHRSRLTAALQAIADRRVAARQVELCESEVAQLQAKLLAAQTRLQDAKAARR